MLTSIYYDIPRYWKKHLFCASGYCEYPFQLENAMLLNSIAHFGLKRMLPGSNQYLSAAALYLAGLDGIPNQLNPQDWINPEKQVEAMTTTQRCEILQDSALYVDFFGTDVIEWLVKQAKKTAKGVL